jgi:hypothetical protein
MVYISNLCNIQSGNVGRKLKKPAQTLAPSLTYKLYTKLDHAVLSLSLIVVLLRKLNMRIRFAPEGTRLEYGVRLEIPGFRPGRGEPGRAACVGRVLA